MTLDMDLVRQILTDLEAVKWTNQAYEIKVDGYDDADVMYHVKMMGQAGLLNTLDSSTMDGPEIYPIDITWQGQQFFQKVKSDAIYQQAKSTVLQKTGALAFDLLAAVATRLAERAVFGS